MVNFHLASTIKVNKIKYQLNIYYIAVSSEMKIINESEIQIKNM